MKLSELDPSWRDGGRALLFLCPCCRKVQLRIPFASGPNPQWRKYGTTFEDLTVQPSIDATPHWHGYIEEGQIKDVAKPAPTTL